MDKAWSRDQYRELVKEVHACVRACVPPGAVVLIASKGDEALVRVDGVRGWHFPRDEWGSYAGQYPASSLEGIVHLRHLYAQGARYLVFPATAAWWLEHYRELADFLDSAHELRLSREGVCVVYELRESPEFDAFAAMSPAASTAGGDGSSSTPGPLLTLASPASSASPRVLTILARFGTDQYREAESDIAELFARQLPAVDRQVLVVDNAQPRDVVEQRADGSTVIGGDNSTREFSAFDRALEFVGANIWDYDFVHFATSAFRTLYVAYLDRFENVERAFAIQAAFARFHRAKTGPFISLDVALDTDAAQVMVIPVCACRHVAPPAQRFVGDDLRYFRMRRAGDADRAERACGCAERFAYLFRARGSHVH